MMNLSQALKQIEDCFETGIGRSHSVSLYSHTVREYENAVETACYMGPLKVAEVMASLFPRNRNQVKILDVAAGSGFVGLELCKVGFTKIDAVDPSKEMLDAARKRNVYQRIICDYVDNQHQIDVLDNHYDAVTLSGAMGNNHLQPGAFDEMIRVVKPGGVLVNVARKDFFKKANDYINILEPHFRKLEASRKWKEESRSTFSDYLVGFDGIALVHRVLAN